MTASHANPLGALALICLVALVLGLGGLSFTARQLDAAAAASERDRVAAALDRKWAALETAIATVAQETSWQGPNTVRVAAEGLDLLARVDPGQDPIVVARRGPDDAVRSPREALARLARPVASGSTDKLRRLFATDGVTFAALALPRGDADANDAPEHGRAVLIGLVAVDEAFLADVSFKADTRPIRLVAPGAEPASASGSLAIDDASGYRLAWEVVERGDHLMLAGGTTLVGLAALFAALAIVRAKRYAGEAAADGAAAREASNHDWLSGLPNRVYFAHTLENELKLIRSTRKRVALLYVDLDRFRDVNDAFGIATGDRMIQVVTQRIANVVRRGDLAARFEGDAFMVLQRDVQDIRDCELLAERIQDAMYQPFELDGSRITASVSIGVAVAPDDAGNSMELIRLANLALYRAKREGRNRVAFYKPVLEDEWRRRAAIVPDLRRAIEEHGLVLHYQPIVAGDTERVVAVEALVRWQHPVEGLIVPDRFIGLAEDRGLIIPLGEWVLRQACLDARRFGDLRVAVNVSPVQFRHRDFVGSVLRILSETGLEPCRLELELTEGVIVDNEYDALQAMNRLRESGVRLALDDFGTGYSSLIYLRRFAFDKIKIDRAFIDALEPSGESAILVDSVVRLGRALGLTVTAEGVETLEQLEFLKGLECPELQGYLISRPLELEGLRAFLGLRERDHEGAEPEHAPFRAVA